MNTTLPDIPSSPAPLPEGGAGGWFIDLDVPNNHQDSTPPQRPHPLQETAHSAPSANSAVQLPPPPFHPTEEAADDIIAAYIDPDQTLTEIASRFKVSIRALAHWLNQPDTLQHIHNLMQAAAQRTRCIAIANERLALKALLTILEGHLDIEASVPVNTQSLKAIAQRDRARATARLAASQLIRLAGRGLCGTGVPPVQSALGPHATDARPRRTPTAPNPHISQSQAGRLCHTDHQTSTPPNPDSSPAHPLTSTLPHPDLLRVSACDPVFQHAACAVETG